MAKDLYKVLDVDKRASADEIKSAYRKMAKKYHPDMYSTASESEKKEAEEKFKEISHAYEVLSDDERRSMYDTYGIDNAQAGGGGGGGFWGNAQNFDFDLGDIFSSFFGGFGGRGSSRTNYQTVGNDIGVTLNITFEEAVFGVEKDIKIKRSENCSDCKGTGAKNGTSLKTCSRCNGTGVYQNVQRTPLGQFATQSVCPDCKGTGKIITENCSVCNGKGRKNVDRTIKVNVPAGIDSEQRMTYYNEGEAGYNGGPNGNLIILIKIKPHKYFVRKGTDIYVDYPITIIQASLGCSIQIPTLDGKVDLEIPEGTQSGAVFRIKNKGVKYLKKEQYGDLYVNIIVEVPKSLTKEQRELLFKFDSSTTAKQFPKKKAFREKM